MILEKKDLYSALSALSKNAKVYAPIVKTIEDPLNAGKTTVEKVFGLYSEGAVVAIDGPNTVKPPKDVLFTNMEKMYTYKTGGNAHITETAPPDGETVLFGIRPCDMRSIESMDKVFFTRDYVDSYYAKRRANATVVCIGCTEASKTCFCGSMGLDPNFAGGADVMVNPCKGTAFKECAECGYKVVADDGRYSLEALTDKGKKLLGQISEFLTEGGEPLRETECALKIKKDENLAEKLNGMFSHPIWDKITKGCIGCGTCTFVCPTCYCFDIDSENYGNEGTKYRCWDSCMFSDYTRMAGGANPRPTKKERLRNRYMHKLCYFNERYGETLCTGCGRCIENCPAHLDISEFIEKASAVKQDAESYSDADFIMKDAGNSRRQAGRAE